MTERRDYLSVCNDHGVPLPDFQAMFCSRCVQPECARSRSGSLFETRVATWEDRLFVNPVRMGKEDPRYAVLSAKRFIDIDVSRIPEVNGQAEWVDPRALEEPRGPSARPRAAAAPREASPPPDVVSAVAEVPQAQTPRAPLNTSFTQGALLVDPTAVNVSKPVDRWTADVVESVPRAGTESIPIVEAGAKLKFKKVEVGVKGEGGSALAPPSTTERD